MQRILKLFILLLKMLYSIIKHMTHTQNKITFISRQGDAPSNDILLLAKALKRRQPDLHIVYLCKRLETNFPGLISYGVHMMRQLYHLATSKAIILDSYCIVASLLNHRNNLLIFQMWHSMGSMKKFGYTAIGTQEGSSPKIAQLMKMHANYDFAFASAPSYIKDLAAGFGTDPQKIVVMPLPRLDLLTDKDFQKCKQEEILVRYPHLANKKNILYCPTFRKNTKDTELHLRRLHECIDETKYNLIVKLHPIEQTHIQNDKLFAPADFSTFDFLSVADVVISDYSCVVFEAAVLNIPLYFYAYDLSEYETSRGLAIDYINECPGPISSEPKALLKAISEEQYDWSKLSTFKDHYIRATGTASLDMADFILSQIKLKEKNA